ncbi:MAG: hypothetical protein ACREC1_00145 [Methylovirgula sp.]
MSGNVRCFFDTNVLVYLVSAFVLSADISRRTLATYKSLKHQERTRVDLCVAALMANRLPSCEQSFEAVLTN